MNNTVFDENFEHTAPSNFKYQAIINGSPEQVFAAVTSDEEKFWYPKYEKVVWLTEHEQGVGATKRLYLSYLNCLEQYSIWEEGKRARVWVSDFSIPLTRKMMVDYFLEATEENKTQLRYHIYYQINPWLKFIHPLLHFFYQRDFQHVIDCLQHYFDNKQAVQ